MALLDQNHVFLFVNRRHYDAVLSARDLTLEAADRNYQHDLPLILEHDRRRFFAHVTMLQNLCRTDDDTDEEDPDRNRRSVESYLDVVFAPTEDIVQYERRFRLAVVIYARILPHEQALRAYLDATVYRSVWQYWQYIPVPAKSQMY